jgi:SAM-dependent methyltransferase
MRTKKDAKEEVRAEKDAYDTVSYRSFPYPDTHPDRLAVMAILHGLAPAPVDRCRVLEIACNEGANLIPMGYAIPGSKFVGFDLARLPIERGQTRIRELALTNVRLFESDLLDVGSELGQFDYIIAHGLYAWVPEPVRDRLLALCRELLTSHGVAFVSYNALPGGHLRKMIREMMLCHVQRIEDPEEKVTGGLAFLRFIVEARAPGDAFRLLIEEQLKQMQKRSPEAIYHDELSAIHHPLHFSEFVEHARGHGLQYLSESVLPPPTDPRFRSDLQPALESAAGDDIIAQEQVLDFVRMRMYRETLLCRAECKVCHDIPAEAFSKLFFASQATTSPGQAPGAQIFTLPGGIRMESSHAGTITLMEQLANAWPCALSFAEIESTLVASGLAGAGAVNGEGATLLMRLAVAKMIELHAWRAPVAPQISVRPRASASARQEACTRAHATTLLHTTLRLEDPIVRSFLRLLDGTRDRDTLFGALKTEFPAMPREQLEQGIEPSLKLLHRAGLLEA